MRTQPGILDALIIGAGPTGLVMSHELMRHGLSCRLVDKLEAPMQQSRATDLQPRTLEIFEDMGVLGEVSKYACTLKSMNIYSTPQRKRLVRVDFTVIDSPYPYMYGISQQHTERALTASLTSRGGVIERGIEYQGFEQDDDGVTTTLVHASGKTERVRSRWLIGCDGSHSPVRHTLGLPFEGVAYPEMYLVADVRIQWEMPDDDLYIFLNDDGYMIVLAMPDAERYRVMLDIDPGQSAEPEFSRIDELFQRRVHIPSVLSEPTWIAPFKIHRRIVPKYRVGNVFLAGDSAHVHSPMNGQGINVGIQDAYNLAWKMSLVRRGQAISSLLDTYNEERRPIGEFICMDTERANKAMRLRNTVAVGLRNTIAPLLLGVKQVNKKVAEAFSELDLHYRGSSIVGEKHTPLHKSRLSHSDQSETASLADRKHFKKGPAAGERAPDVYLPKELNDDKPRLFDFLAGTHHTLLLFDGSAATPEGYQTLIDIAQTVKTRFGGLVRPYIVIPMDKAPPALKWDGGIIYDAEGLLHERYGSAAESMYLIRPDLYVGFRSQPAEKAALLEHLRRYLTGA